MKALIVDDSRAMRTLLRAALREEGFETFEAADGRAALEGLRETGAVDLALIDWNMPIMSGYELIREIRSNRAYDKMAIMMVTTESELCQVQRSLEAGANEYVMKPFTEDVIREKLLLLGFSKE